MAQGPRRRSCSAASRSRRPATSSIDAARRPRDPPDQRPRRRLLQGAAPGASSRALGEPLRAGARRRARDRALGRRASTSPTFERDYEFVALAPPGEYPFNEGRIVSNRGLDIAAREYDAHFEENTSRTRPRCTRRSRDARHLSRRAARALQPELRAPARRSRARRRGRPASARSAATRSRASSCARSRCSTPATRRCASSTPTRRRTPPASRSSRAPATGYGATEAPRGLLYHRYRLDDDGTIADAQIVPPTSQNQATIEDDLTTLHRRLARPARRRAPPCAASRRSATTTRASPARPTSSTCASTG